MLDTKGPFGGNVFKNLARYTAVSRKVVRKSAHDNPERYCGWFCLPCSPKEIEIMAREATDICLRVLWKATKVGLTATVVRNSVLIISHITFRDCRLHFFLTTFSKQLMYITMNHVTFLQFDNDDMTIEMSRFFHIVNFCFNLNFDMIFLKIKQSFKKNYTRPNKSMQQSYCPVCPKGKQKKKLCC